MDAAVAPDLAQARALLERALVWDNHGCMPVGRPNDTSFLPQLQRYRAAGVDVAMINVGFGDQGIEDHLRTLATMRHWLLARPDDYVLIDGPDDIKRARAKSASSRWASTSRARMRSAINSA